MFDGGDQKLNSQLWACLSCCLHPQAARKSLSGGHWGRADTGTVRPVGSVRLLPAACKGEGR